MVPRQALNNPIFDNNITALETANPELAQLLRQPCREESNLETVSTKTAAPSIRVHPPDGAKPVLLHSAYDPIREAQRWAESIEITSPVNVFVFGAGLGYHLLALLRQHEAHIRFFIVIEQNLDILRAAFSTIDLRRFLTRKGARIIAGADPRHVSDLLEEERTDIIVHNFQLFNHDPSIRCYRDYYTQVHETLMKQLTHDEVNLRTTIESQGRNQFNVYMNLPAMFRGYALRDCQGILKGYPAVVAAAGPSLDKNVHRLNELDDRAALIVVDTAQSTFVKHRIEPHAVVTGDPTPLNFSHFDTIDRLGDAFLVFHPEVNRQITQKYLDHPFLLPLFDENSFLLSHLFDLENEYGTMERAMNVGHLAFNLAHHLGCDPIVLAGFDFAFPRDGGTTHVAGAAVSRRMDAMQEDGTITIGGKEGKAIEESGKMMLVPGYDGDKVPTTVPFSLYIRAIEKSIREFGVRVIDATEGGAYFEGTERMPLQDALEQTLKEPGVSKCLAAFRQQRKSADLHDITAKIEEGRRLMSRSLDACRTMMEMLRQWQRLLETGQVNAESAQQRWNEFNNVWVGMCQEPLFDGFLGNSVQHLYLRRQQSTAVRNDNPQEFLQVMHDKYQSILSEMMTIIQNFSQCMELAVQALHTTNTE